MGFDRCSQFYLVSFFAPSVFACFLPREGARHLPQHLPPEESKRKRRNGASSCNRKTREVFDGLRLVLRHYLNVFVFFFFAGVSFLFLFFWGCVGERKMRPLGDCNSGP